MPADHPDLAALRQEIDRIDDAVHDLLMERAALAQRASALKAEGAALRPGREASILRRLLARHSGPLPSAAVVRIWRELFAALTAVQRPFTMAVFQAEDGPDYVRLAVDHFGSITPVTRFGTVGLVVNAVIEGAASVGVVPVSEYAETDPWWLRLVLDHADMPRVVARLPVLRRGEEGRGPPPLEALAIASIRPDSTGEDRSLLVIETGKEVSRGWLKTALDRADLHLHAVSYQRPPAQEGSWMHLVEVDGTVGPDDPRLARLPEGRDSLINRAVSLGGYAVPLTAV